jgi:hypothetical protein
MFRPPPPDRARRRARCERGDAVQRTALIAEGRVLTEGPAIAFTLSERDAP